MAEMIPLTLSNPLSADQAAQLRAEDIKDYRVGDEIRVPTEEARAVIDAGYAQVDRTDRAAVAAALNPRPRRSSGSASSGEDKKPAAKG